MTIVKGELREGKAENALHGREATLLIGSNDSTNCDSLF
jgi:hypothetical protein